MTFRLLRKTPAASGAIKNVAFKFVDERNLMQALIRTIEGSIRAYVATKKQADVLVLRKDIVEHVKAQLDTILETWGYHLQDLQLNDITFDEVILKSMSQVVASNNLKAAAENEGQALLITKTKAAEAEGNAIKIAAEAERQAAQLRGQGIEFQLRIIIVFYDNSRNWKINTSNWKNSPENWVRKNWKFRVNFEF